MMQDEVLRFFLTEAKTHGEPFDIVARWIDKEPLLQLCKKRFEDVKWLFWVYKDGGPFSNFAKNDLIEMGYLCQNSTK